MHPKLNFEPNLRVDNMEEGQVQSLTCLLAEIHNIVKAEMAYAQDQQCKYTDNYQIPTLSYLLGDTVWLNTRNLHTNCPSHKGDNCHYGPFTTIKEVGKYAYQLDLPTTIDIYLVFHVSLLEPTCRDPMPSQQLPLPKPVIIDREPEYEVEDIVNSHIFRCQLQYLIKWCGWDALT
jgi:hypothetical protein